MSNKPDLFTRLLRHICAVIGIEPESVIDQPPKPRPQYAPIPGDPTRSRLIHPDERCETCTHFFERWRECHKHEPFSVQGEPPRRLSAGPRDWCSWWEEKK